jgi:ferredoxin-type protein NapH
VIAAAAVLFLPPLSFLFQFTADSNFCGKWCPRMFFVWRQGMSAEAYFTSYIRSYMGVILIFGMLGVTFFLGRYWCSHLCPIGGTMELGSRAVPGFLKINFSKVPAPAFRYGYLAVYFGAAAAGIGSLCCNYCHFATVPRIFGAAFSQADLSYFLRTAGLINLGLVVVLGLLAKGGRAYCNLLCPIGALDALANAVGARFGRRLRVSTARCNGCGLCEPVCPTWAIKMTDIARIDPLACMPCHRCETACPQVAITYGKTVTATQTPEWSIADEKA